jgi:RimJ/RimL family protein N-acetyltransferase
MAMFARTERLMLRPGWIEDAPALSRAIGEEAVVRNLARAPWPYALGDAQAYLRAPADRLLPNFLIFARTQGSPRLVGGIGLHRDDSGAAELGYWIARPYWGLGFATEAGSAVIDLAQNSLRLNRLVAGHFLDNPASAHVLRKLGFAPTGRIDARPSRARRCLVPFVPYERVSEAASAGDMPRLAA